MTVVLTGKAPSGNIMVTDAIVTMKDDSTSHKECRLKDKIAELRGANCYCTILGDERVLFGIQLLDEWYRNKSISIDFSNQKYMEEALIASEKFIKLFNKQGHIPPTTDGATVYFVSRDFLFEYKISLKNDKYTITKFRHFDDNEVILNYAGSISNKTPFVHSSDKIFVKSCEAIEDFHSRRKIDSKRIGDRKHLKYDFDNRFCGVVFSNLDEPVKIYIPYNNLSEIIASQADDVKLLWELIEDKSFSWTPGNSAMQDPT